MHTSAVARKAEREQRNASELWDACTKFVKSGDPRSFQALQDMLIEGRNLPLVATFPAFMQPARFPMVDIRVARWVDRYLNEHQQNVRRGEPPLVRKQSGGNGIALSDWEFYDAWVKWTRWAALILTRATGQKWRARDIEMAAFQNSNEQLLLPQVR